MVNMGKAIGITNNIQWKDLNNTWLSRKETYWQWPLIWMSSTWPGSSTKSVSKEHISKSQPRASIRSSSSARTPKLYYNEMIHHNPYIIYKSYIKYIQILSIDKSIILLSYYKYQKYISIYGQMNNYQRIFSSEAISYIKDSTKMSMIYGKHMATYVSAFTLIMKTCKGRDKICSVIQYIADFYYNCNKYSEIS